MLSNFKVNINDRGSDIISSRQDNNVPGIKSGSSDFYSMVMNYNADISRRENVEKSYSNDRSCGNIREDAAAAGEKLNDKRQADDGKIGPDRESEKNPTAENTVNHSETLEKKPETDYTVKGNNSVIDKKENRDKSEITDILHGAAGELIMKKINDLVKTALKADTGDFSKNFKKAAEDILSSLKKKTDPGQLSEKITGGVKGGASENNSGTVLTEFLNRLEREIAKIISDKKMTSRTPAVSEREIKETIAAVLDDIKKVKSRNHDKAELKRTEAETVKHEKKTDDNNDMPQIKRKEAGNAYSPDFSAGKERNSSRDNSPFSSGRLETTGRNGIERNDFTGKSPEFRQSLQEIIDKAKVSVKDGNNASFSVKLFPKDLGSVNVSLLMENGVVSGRFLVASDEARALLLNNLETLMEQLAEAGIQLGDFNVNVNHGGERFASENEDDSNDLIVIPGRRESEAAMNQYDYNASAGHDGHINMVI